MSQINRDSPAYKKLLQQLAAAPTTPPETGPSSADEGELVGESEVRPAQIPMVMTVDELAVLLRVNRKTAYEAVQRGEIPGVRRVGRTLRVSRDAVLEWLAAGQGRVSPRRR